MPLVDGGGAHRRISREINHGNSFLPGAWGQPHRTAKQRRIEQR